MKKCYPALLMTLLANWAGAQGTLVIDQQSTNGTATVGSDQVYQSFTPGLSSIAFVQLGVYDPNQAYDGLAQVYVNLLAGSTNGPILGTTATVGVPMYLTGPSSFSTLLFSTPVTLTPGTTYYLQPIGVSNNQSLDFLISTTPYPGGAVSVGGSAFGANSLWFTEGIVVVPEPSALILTLTGGLTLFVLRRMRKHNI